MCDTHAALFGEEGAQRLCARTWMAGGGRREQLMHTSFLHHYQMAQAINQLQAPVISVSDAARASAAFAGVAPSDGSTGSHVGAHVYALGSALRSCLPRVQPLPAAGSGGRRRKSSLAVDQEEEEVGTYDFYRDSHVGEIVLVEVPLRRLLGALLELLRMQPGHAVLHQVAPPSSPVPKV